MQALTTDLLVYNQGINIDIESISPLRSFAEGSYDVANMTITATVQSPATQTYRLVLAADVEAGTSAFVRVISSSDATFAATAKFKRIPQKDAEIILPVLQKAGLVTDPTTLTKEQIIEHSRHFKVADLAIPQGAHVLRIHASQKLIPLPGEPRRFSFTMYAPQLSLNPAGNVRLGVTVVFPLDFAGVIDTPRVESLDGQAPANVVAGGDTPIELARQTAYAWTFQADPKVTFSYSYPG